MGATTEVAEWVAGFSLDGASPEALVAARAGIIDTVGVILAGVPEPVSRIAAEVTAEDGARPVADQIGGTLRTSMDGAAFVNAVSGHALDYDDVNASLRGHPSVVVLPAALAAAQSRRASGRALVEAYIAGVEVMAKLGAAMGPAHYQAGWHATSTLGPLGSAAAAGRLLGLDPARLTHALAIAASQGSGLQQNFGTMTKPFHPGHAARSGLQAARLARHGLSGDATALEGRAGFFAVFSRGQAQLDGLRERLGRPLDIVAPGLSVKKYPCCFATHRAADAVLDLAAAHDIAAPDVTSVTVSVPPGGRQPLIHDRPATGLEGKFSMPYVVAAALIDRRLTLDSFTDGAVQRPEAQALLRRVRTVEDPTLRADEFPLERGRVEVEIVVGGGGTGTRRFTAGIRHPRGSQQLPLRPGELEAKFMDCAARALPAETAGRALSLLGSIETVADVNTLLQALVPGRTPTAVR